MRFALWGNFGTHNLGNECTLHAMVVAARRLRPEAELVAVCPGPEDTRTRHGIDAVPMEPSGPEASPPAPRSLRQLRRLTGEAQDFARAVGVMRNVDRLIVAGTGILTDTHQGPLGLPYQMFKWAAAARLCGRPVAFASIGAESLTAPFKLRFMRWALELANYRSFRDPLSKTRATSLTTAVKDDPIYPDLAFSLPEALTSARVTPPGGGGQRTVAVGIYAVETGPEGVGTYVETIGSFVLWLLEQGHRVRIVIGDAQYDRTALTRVRSYLADKHVADRVIDEPAASFELLFEQLAEADLVVATRFHNVLCSLLLEKPVVSVSHMEKNDQLMSAMGLSAYCLPLAGAGLQAIIAKFRDLERNADALKKQIREKNTLFREQLEAQYRILFQDPAEVR